MSIVQVADDQVIHGSMWWFCLLRLLEVLGKSPDPAWRIRLLCNLSLMPSPHAALLAPEEQEIHLLFARPWSERKIEAPSTKARAQAAEASECRRPWWKSTLRRRIRIAWRKIEIIINELNYIAKVKFAAKLIFTIGFLLLYAINIFKNTLVHKIFFFKT